MTQGDSTYSIAYQVDRRVNVERLALRGYNVNEIAKRLGINRRTVMKDLEYIKRYNGLVTDSDKIRGHVARAMLSVADTAHRRYEEDKNVTEGRLVVDAYSRLSKVIGLDEPKGNIEVSAALTELLLAIKDKLNG